MAETGFNISPNTIAKTVTANFYEDMWHVSNSNLGIDDCSQYAWSAFRENAGWGNHIYIASAGINEITFREWTLTYPNNGNITVKQGSGDTCQICVIGIKKC